MSFRLEIVTGPGTVARYGEVCVWAAPGASDTLLKFLVDSGRNVGSVPHGGTRIADHIAFVLSARDPEPGLGFATVGPSERGTDLLLHGSIQAWDGHRWLVPPTQPGWMRVELPGRPGIVVTAHGAPPAVAARPSDLVQGVVPAGGFVLVPDTEAAPATTLAPAAGRPDEALPTTVMAPTGHADEALPTTVMAPTGHADEAPPTTVMAPTGHADEAPPTTVMAPTGHADETPPTTVMAPTGHADEARAPLDLTPAAGLRPPLPTFGAVPPPVAGEPVVAGLRCPGGHFNHPAAPSCVTCGRPIDDHQGRVSSTRPSLGVLVTDDGGVYRLDTSYLIGSAPDADPTVSGRRARPLLFGSQPAVAPAHVEIRLSGWTVHAVARSAALVLGPGQTAWSELRPFAAHILSPGSHLALGDRVVSIISPWPIDQPGS